MNYPDDIRRYDSDPRSPFCPEWICPECGGDGDYVDCQIDACQEKEQDDE